jgi:hypothetical protein
MKVIYATIDIVSDAWPRNGDELEGRASTCASCESHVSYKDSCPALRLL